MKTKMKIKTRKNIKFPKRAKLITDGGFSKIINIPSFVPTITVPLIKRIQLASPETDVTDLSIHFDVSFEFDRALKNIAIYKQIDVVSIVK